MQSARTGYQYQAKIGCYKHMAPTFTRCIGNVLVNKGTGMDMLSAINGTGTYGRDTSFGKRDGIYTSIMGKVPV
jgi:hypothetical protein